ncbi:MAG TPA: hypothetical protein ENJ82_07380 [Bacteroidetes bacterium]|nr:hypothetical protein [Bacteroidota bacterium]
MIFTKFLSRTAVYAVLLLSLSVMGCERLAENMEEDHFSDAAIGSYRGVLTMGADELPGLNLQVAAAQEGYLKFEGEHSLLELADRPMFNDCGVLNAEWGDQANFRIRIDLMKQPVHLEIWDSEADWKFVADKNLVLVTP